MISFLDEGLTDQEYLGRVALVFGFLWGVSPILRSGAQSIGTDFNGRRRVRSVAQVQRLVPLLRLLIMVVIGDFIVLTVYASVVGLVVATAYARDLISTRLVEESDLVFPRFVTGTGFGTVIVVALAIVVDTLNFIFGVIPQLYPAWTYLRGFFGFVPAFSVDLFNPFQARVQQPVYPVEVAQAFATFNVGHSHPGTRRMKPWHLVVILMQIQKVQRAALEVGPSHHWLGLFDHWFDIPRGSVLRELLGRVMENGAFFSLMMIPCVRVGRFVVSVPRLLSHASPGMSLRALAMRKLDLSRRYGVAVSIVYAVPMPPTMVSMRELGLRYPDRLLALREFMSCVHLSVMLPQHPSQLASQLVLGDVRLVSLDLGLSQEDYVSIAVL